MANDERGLAPPATTSCGSPGSVAGNTANLEMCEVYGCCAGKGAPISLCLYMM